jgi:carbonic anhydrase/acetyltransferase-like protein (isoleucine patch superfamily)
MIYQLGDKAPQIDNTVFIADSADVIGQVILKENASVWFNAVIRADGDLIEIGARTNIQDGAVLHCDPGQPLIIGEDVTVGHKAMIHCREIGDRTLVGINAVVLEGAHVGSDCIIGANSLVKAGEIIPDGSLVVGSPAKILRKLDEQAKVLLQGSAEHYVHKAASMFNQLEKIEQ